MKHLRAAIFAALFVSSAGQTTQAAAQQVTLASPDGAIALAGTLLGYDGDFYRIDTTFGVLTLDAARVDCTGAACPVPGPQVSRFTLAGAGEMAGALMPPLIETFARDAGYGIAVTETGPGERLYRLADRAGSLVAEITLRASSTEDGIVDMITEQADMALALREVDATERAIARDAGLGDLTGPRQFRVLARDALVPVVNAANPVRHIRIPELAEVYAGDLATWSPLGGGDGPITRHLTDPGTGIGAVFAAQVVAASDLALSTDLVLHPDATTLVDAVATDPAGIGVTTLTRAGAARTLSLTGDCGLDSAADPVTVAAGDYPLTLPLYLYLPGRRLPAVARELLVYLRSAQAQEVVRAAGFVDHAFAEIPLAEQGARLANAIRAAGPEVSLADLQRMMPLFIGRERLSLTFRFREGTTELDAPSLANVRTLAAALDAGDFAGRKLAFAGFSDGAGSAAANLTLSQRRAEAVRAAVLAWARAVDPASVEIEAEGFGEALPMACDDTPWGRQVNRRVEVWVDQPLQ
ncbi:MAG: phosphate ABC transporter substrate-binding/OmpA family protein [Paracoccaceae bacterium]